jgi:glycosyltransferase involved in cell wall biosynthesis
MTHPLFEEWGRSKIRTFIEAKMERAVIRGADAIICNTPKNKERLMQAYPEVAPDRFKVIPNGFDKEFIDAITPRSFPKLTIAHTGLFYPHLKPYFFFEVLAQWIKARENEQALDDRFQVLLVGSREENLSNLLENLNLAKYVQIIDRVSHQDALAIAKGADVLLISLGFDKRATGWIPLKLYDYLGCRKPILGFLPDGGQAARVVAEGNVGEIVSTPDREKVFDFLDTLCGLNGEAEYTIPFDPCGAVLEKYEQSFLTKQLAEILDDLAV